MKENRIGEVDLGEQRIRILAYADDMVIVAKNSDAIIEEMKILRKFFKERNLT